MRLTMIHKHFPNVKKIVHATRPITIEVTEKDCKAIQKSPTDCAIARAARNQLHADGAIILPSTTYLIRGKKALRFTNPPATEREISSFDRGSGFLPGKYRLSASQPTPAKKTKRPTGPHRYHRKMVIHRTQNIRTQLDV